MSPRGPGDDAEACRQWRILRQRSASTSVGIPQPKTGLAVSGHHPLKILAKAVVSLLHRYCRLARHLLSLKKGYPKGRLRSEKSILREGDSIMGDQNQRCSGVGVSIAFLSGAIIGAVAAILYAP